MSEGARLMKIDRPSLAKIVELAKDADRYPFSLYYDKETGIFYTESEAPFGITWVYDVDEADTEEIIIGMLEAVLEGAYE